MPSATTKMGRGFLSIHHQIVAAASPAVCDLATIASASKATENQFLTLRVTWSNRMRYTKCFKKLYGQYEIPNKIKSEVDKYLAKFESFQEFIQREPFEHDLSNPKLGGFAVVLDALRAIPRNEPHEPLEKRESQGDTNSPTELA